MEFPKLAAAFLLILSIGFAHSGGELRFVNGFIIEFHSESDFEFTILTENGTFLNSAPSVKVYRGDTLIKESVATPASEDGYYMVVNDLPAGKYEIRPEFTIGDKVAAARYDYEKEGNIIDKIIAFIISLFTREKTTDVHEHADFALYINGTRMNLSQQQYMENSSKPMSELVHLHDMNGNVIHKHAKGVTLGHFFGTIGVNVEGMQLYVNGVKNEMNENYEFNDLDRLLILIGNYNESVDTLISSVSDVACIQSGKCPERGTPFNESSCTTAGGCEL